MPTRGKLLACERVPPGAMAGRARATRRVPGGALRPRPQDVPREEIRRTRTELAARQGTHCYIGIRRLISNNILSFKWKQSM